MTPPERSRSQGEPFTPLGRCRIATPQGVLLLEPAASGGGRYYFVPGCLGPLDAPDLPEGLRGEWADFDWVRWVADEDGPGFRMRIGVGDTAAGRTEVVSGPVRRIVGDFTTDDAVVCGPSTRPRAAARLGRLLRFTLP
ncbi:MAG TPA: hypothetical protein VMV22_03545 [Acidimicrobiales bacterium]|nr:hypothetical protein [Acidimicrobiales bacterium]